MRLSVGLTTCFRWRSLIACLESISKQRDDVAEIICVEDGITHPNIERICDDYGVRFIQLPMPKPHRRLCECHNILFDECKTDILVRASQDQVFGDGFFANAREIAETAGESVIVIPFVAYLEDDTIQGEHETMFHNSYSITDAAWRAADRPINVLWPKNLPRFDTAFNLVGAYEGVEWAWRCWKAGYKVVMRPDLHTMHLGHPSYPDAEQLKIAEALFVEKTGGELTC